MEGMPFTERNASANVMSIVISSLNPFTNYSVKMAASTVIGQGIFSSEVAFRTNESGIVQPWVTWLSNNGVMPFNGRRTTVLYA